MTWLIQGHQDTMGFDQLFHWLMIETPTARLGGMACLVIESHESHATELAFEKKQKFLRAIKTKTTMIKKNLR